MSNVWTMGPQYNASAGGMGDANTTMLGIGQGVGGFSTAAANQQSAQEYQSQGAPNVMSGNTAGYGPNGFINGGPTLQGSMGGSTGGIYNPLQGVSNTFAPAGGAASGGSAAAAGGNISSLIAQQQASNDAARAQNQSNWDSAKSYLQGLPGQYSSDPANTGANRVTQSILNNPDVLSQQVQQNIMNRAQNQIGASAQAGLNTQYGMMAADGQTDSSSMAAAKAASDRNAFAALGNSATGLGIQAATANRASEQAASQLGQQQANNNINPAMTVGNSIMSHLPQVKPDDYSGLMALSNQMSNQQAQNQMMQQQFAQQNQLAQLGLSMQQNAANRPQNPSASRLLGPNDGNQSQAPNKLAGFGQPQMSGSTNVYNNINTGGGGSGGGNSGGSLGGSDPFGNSYDPNASSPTRQDPTPGY